MTSNILPCFWAHLYIAFSSKGYKVLKSIISIASSNCSAASKAQYTPLPYVIIPTLGETLDYNYSFTGNSRVIIRILDISGRFVTSLVDKYYVSSGTVTHNEQQSAWDGRDHLGQIVNPGTYILHIETLNPLTGETHSDAAPIVVGVKN